MTELNPEVITIIFGGLSGAIGLITILWKKFLKPIVKLCKNQDFFMESVNDIKKELTTNGGSSLKDAIISMGKSCERIEERQKVIIQRTKAALHYSGAALFETDEDGRMIWSNANFFTFLPAGGTNLEGFDWLNIIHEDEREDVLKEFMSCLTMNRRFSRPTKNFNGEEIRFLGYPYRIDEDKHGGFLISVSKTEEV